MSSVERFPTRIVVGAAVLPDLSISGRGEAQGFYMRTFREDRGQIADEPP